MALQPEQSGLLILGNGQLARRWRGRLPPTHTGRLSLCTRWITARSTLPTRRLCTHALQRCTLICDQYRRI